MIGFIFIGWCSGFLGSMVGLGGGIIMVPALTMVYGVDIKTAISASLVSMIATSVMASSVFAKKDLIHFKLGLILITTTIVGSFAGSYLAIFLRGPVLMMLFATLMVIAAFSMVYRIYRRPDNDNPSPDENIDHSSGFLDIQGKYSLEGPTRVYVVHRVPANIVLSTFAGCLSGMLGVGGGIIQVPIMHMVGRVPIKIATATSSFMIGFTGLAGALIYFLHDQISPVITASMVIGIIAGSYLGSRVAVKAQSIVISWILILALLITSTRMFAKAW